ncbi:hypothetical protein IWQ56_004628 [Coemansia nantahalensis]|nr:hypothetical protein IWQ56_004628 [Coemansia nantahalensis]
MDAFLDDEYAFTAVLYTDNGIIHRAEVDERKFNLDSIQGTALDRSIIYPSVDQIEVPVTVFDKDNQCGEIFVKGPNLVACDASSGESSTTTAHEIRGLEAIFRGGHLPYVVRYYGCKIEDGLVTGICLEKCRYTLEEAIRAGVISDVDKFIDNVAAGIRSIHGVGYVHDDINHTNVMVTSTGEPRIIDFDSAKLMGSPRDGRKCGTFGWERESDIAEEENDTYPLPKLKEFIADLLAQSTTAGNATGDPGTMSGAGDSGCHSGDSECHEISD